MLAVVLPLRGISQQDDTTRAIRIIDNYIGMMDLERIDTDSAICITTYVIDQSHTEDTMFIYRWYQGDRYRIEIWQGGRVGEGVYSDGEKTHRRFHSGQRQWVSLTRESLYGFRYRLDVRGALLDWRIKGAEPRYDSEVTYNGAKADRLFVQEPGKFDRYYYFEQASGLLFMVTEENHSYGDARIVDESRRVDYRGWHEFIPFRGLMMPSIESYQAGGSKVVLYHHYSIQQVSPTLFTEDYHKL